MKREIDFKPGDECIYLEEGGETKCKILEKEIKKKSKDGWLVMKFEAIQNLQPSPTVGEMRKGHIFTAEKVIGVCAPGALWEIREVQSSDF